MRRAPHRHPVPGRGKSRTPARRLRKGLVSILALMILVLFASLAVAFSSSVDLTLQKSRNQCEAVQAQLAAESGMHYTIWALRQFASEPTVSGLPDLLGQLTAHLDETLGASGTAGKITGSPHPLGGGEYVQTSQVALPGGDTFQADAYISEYDSEDPNIPSEVQLIVTGRSGGLTRQLGLRFSVDLDKRLLHYGIASTLRIIARGDVRVHGPVVSSWGRDLRTGVRNNTTYPLDIALGSNGFINGTVGTTLSEEGFIGDPNLSDGDFHDGISSSNPDCDPLSQMAYDEPEVMDLDSNAFDTSPLKDMTSEMNLPAPDQTDYSLGVWGLSGSKWEDHDGTSKPKLHNVRVAEGTNPYFENCTFSGITYIEVDENTDNPTASNQNSVIFKNCTFEGPIITGVPKKMDWENNCMQFQGATIFESTMIQEALGGVTLMAPNYNVNIGGSEGGGGGSESTVVGLVVGGCVDMYNTLKVNGTVISMAHLVQDDQINVAPGGGDSWLAGSGVCGSNLGNLNGSGNDIDIWPDPDNVMPLGIKRSYLISPKLTTYAEVRPSADAYVPETPAE